MRHERCPNQYRRFPATCRRPLENVDSSAPAQRPRLSHALQVRGDRKPKISGAAKIALQALDDALAQHGTVRQQEGVPSCRVVAVSKWREMCDLHALSESDDRDSRKRAFNRASKVLRDRGFVRQYNELVWRCSK